jgi:hypothetical protein
MNATPDVILTLSLSHENTYLQDGQIDIYRIIGDQLSDLFNITLQPPENRCQFAMLRSF